MLVEGRLSLRHYRYVLPVGEAACLPLLHERYTSGGFEARPYDGPLSREWRVSDP